MVRCCDLFSGVGGMRMGFELGCSDVGVGGEVVCSSEVNGNAVRVYERNFGVGCGVGDIRGLGGVDCDILLGGFPCQPFSVAGLGRGFEDARGGMFWEVCRILGGGNVGGFILENVGGLLGHDGGRTLGVMLDALRGLGYGVGVYELDGGDYGVAQRRVRVYLVGIKGGELGLGFISGMGRYGDSGVVVGDILERGLGVMGCRLGVGLVGRYGLEFLSGGVILTDKRGGGRVVHSWDLGLRGEIRDRCKELLCGMLLWSRSRSVARDSGVEWGDGRWLGYGELERLCGYGGEWLSSDLGELVRLGYLGESGGSYRIRGGRMSWGLSRVLDVGGKCPTLTATDGEKLGVCDVGGVRLLSEVEGKRLFGLGDDFDFCGLGRGEVFRLLGNGVVVPVVRGLVAGLLCEMGLGVRPY